MGIVEKRSMQDEPVFERVWKATLEHGKRSDPEEEGRCEQFMDVLRAGGAVKGELRGHMTNVCGALAATSCYETLAVLLRGLGYGEDAILEALKGDLLNRDVGADYALAAFNKANIHPAAETVLAALTEIVDCRGARDGGAVSS